MRPGLDFASGCGGRVLRAPWTCMPHGPRIESQIRERDRAKENPKWGEMFRTASFRNLGLETVNPDSGALQAFSGTLAIRIGRGSGI